MLTQWGIRADQPLGRERNRHEQQANQRTGCTGHSEEEGLERSWHHLLSLARTGDRRRLRVAALVDGQPVASACRYLALGCRTSRLTGRPDARTIHRWVKCHEAIGAAVGVDRAPDE